jgi:hypothetical protein
VIGLDACNAKRASDIVAALTAIAAQLEWTLPETRYQQMVLVGGGREQSVYLSKDAAKAAFNVWRKELEAKRAELRREAARINLNLGDL